MIITLVGINSKYIHTNLAIRKLRAYAEKCGEQVFIKEYSGGEEISRAASDILSVKTECVAFSCYIWNIEFVLKIADIIKKAQPEIKIVLGGPEATYNYKELFENYPFIDMIIAGEGEKAILDLIKNQTAQKLIFGEITDMSEQPFPYTEQELAEEQRIFYYESARGCPYSCTYCLSSAEKGVRYKPAKQVFEDLAKFAAANVRLVKFVDRTFNSDLKRSCKILTYILNLRCDTEFHIEIGADTIDDEFINILKRFPENKLRIETGLQSANLKTLREIRRVCDFDKFTRNISKIIEETNVTLHLDLIAGLPFEDLKSFENSFNFAFNLKPHELQLGFLKVLPGSFIAEQQEKHGIKSSFAPPYEIISNSYMSFKDISKLKNIEAVLEMYHNSGILNETEPLILQNFKSPYHFYDCLAQYMKNENLLSRPHHRIMQFEYLYNFAKKINLDSTEFKLRLAKDYFISCNGAPMPIWAEKFEIQINKEKLKSIINDDEAIGKLPELVKIDKNSRHKYLKIEKLFKMVWLVSIIDKKIVDITPYFSLDF